MPASVATRLSGARRAAGLTQAALAARSGVARSVIAAYETGARQPSADAFLRLLHAAGVTVRIEPPDTEARRRGRALDDVLALVDDLPRREPGELRYPSDVWRR